jgi:hypothetical protein
VVAVKVAPHEDLKRGRAGDVEHRVRREGAVSFGKRLLGPGFAHVLVANGYDKAEFPRASERMDSNIGTPRVIAEIFSEQFFAAVWSLEARLDRYLRNGEPPNQLLPLSMSGGSP